MKLVLENGKVFRGESFGAAKTMTGEVVFNTGMVGYVESLSNPSYEGQILVLTFPLVGNYGVSSAKFFESGKIHAARLVVANYSETYSHHAARESLAEWLKRGGVPAMTGVDTRMITKILREKGVMLGALVMSGKTPSMTDPNKENFVARVSQKRTSIHREMGTKGNRPRIVLVGCGAKESIARSLVARGATIIVRVPWDFDFATEHADGIVILNGPGDPVMCAENITNIRVAFDGKADLGESKKRTLGSS